jgi:hypothetical protein
VIDAPAIVGAFLASVLVSAAIGEIIWRASGGEP